LKAEAAVCYRARSKKGLAAAAGTQMLLPLVMSLAPPGRAAILSPTYAEHARTAALAGHKIRETDDFAELAEADLAVVVNPNNPDGRVTPRDQLLKLARKLGNRGGLLVVDEAFMDVGPAEESLAADVEELPVVVLRSFGKFFGLAGVRLGFAIASENIAARLEAQLGPWAVSGPALELGIRALADAEWQDAMRERLQKESQRLDDLIQRGGLSVCGGTTLFRFVRHPDARSIFDTLGRQGVLVRAFDRDPEALRFGLPGSEDDWTRVERALALWSRH
jgi:cobalamin biosynthesis protein CobC